jgi:hypothetical protein
VNSDDVLSPENGLSQVSHHECFIQCGGILVHCNSRICTVRRCWIDPGQPRLQIDDEPRPNDGIGKRHKKRKCIRTSRLIFFLQSWGFLL